MTDLTRFFHPVDDDDRLIKLRISQLPEPRLREPGPGGRVSRIELHSALNQLSTPSPALAVVKCG